MALPARISSITPLYIPQYKGVCLCLAVVLLAGCAGKVPRGGSERAGEATLLGSGQASWYGGKFHGRKTASGEIFNRNTLTAAHRTLAFGTQLCVRNKSNGRTVSVRINDRGPSSKKRIIDLSEAAAKRLDMVRAGVVPVELWRIAPGAECPKKLP